MDTEQNSDCANIREETSTNRFITFEPHYTLNCKRRFQSKDNKSMCTIDYEFSDFY